MCLLGHVRRGVEAGDRVLRHQQAEAEDVPKDDAAEAGAREARVVDRLGEHVRDGLVIVRDDDQHEDDEEHARHVPVGGDRVEHRRDADLEHVQQDRDHHHDRVCEERPLLGVRVVEPQVEQGRQEDGKPVADRRRDRNLPDEVEPTGEPAPTGASELRRPVVEAACRRVRRRDLRHRERHQRRHETDDQPAPGDGDRAAVVERDEVGGQAPRQDRDDREADGEVLEPAHRTEQLLRVAHPVEDLFVLRRVEPAGRGPAAHLTDLPCRFRGVNSPTARAFCQGTRSQPTT